MGASGFDGSIRIDTSIDGKGFNAGIKKITDSLKGVAVAMGLAFGLRELIAFGKEATKAASDLQIMENKFNAVFGSASETTKKAISALAAQVNMADDDLQELAATAGNTFKAIGFGASDVSTLSVRLTALSEDLATFFNISDKAALDTLQSAMLGRTRGLLQFGIKMDETTIKAKALAMGIGDGTQELSEQAKAQAILQIIIDKTADAQGNAQKTAHTWAGEIRGLAGAWQDFQQAVGKTLILFAPLVGLLRQALTWLAEMANSFAEFISVMFNIDLGSSAAADSIQDAADSTEDLTKAAKGALAAFDQINVLQQDGKAQANTSVIPALALPSIDTSEFDKARAKFQEMKDALMKLLQPAIEAFEKLKKALEPLGKILWEGLKWAWDNVLVPLGTWLITDALPVFLDLLTAAVEFLKEALIAFQPFGQWLWENFLKPAAEWTGKALIAGMQFVIDRLKEMTHNLGEIIEHWPEVGDAAKAAWDRVASAWTNAGSWFNTVVVEPIKRFFSNAWAGLKEGAAEAWKGVMGVWETVKTWFKENVTDALGAALDGLKSRWESAFDGLFGFVKGIINSIIDLINGMLNGFTMGVNSIISSLNSVGSNIPGWTNLQTVTAFQLPHLAAGAVIPPNSQFLAVLGDQRSGRNLEAPEGLIRQIIRDELGSMPGQKISVEFTGSLSELARVLSPAIKQETIRTGGSLVKSGVVS